MKTGDLTQEILGLEPILKAFTLRFTRNREESQDLIQDTLLKALQYRHSYTEHVNLRGWLFTIMRNTFINNYRRSKRFRVTRDDSADLSRLNVGDNHTFSSPDGQPEYMDVWRQIGQIREELSTPFKMYTSGYKYNEIADHLSLPLGTVKNRIFQARKEIQKNLNS
jgi:RNA polymerase sigma factor (sigma-70 family)